MGHWYFDSGNSLTVDLYPISDERVYEDRRERERERELVTRNCTRVSKSKKYVVESQLH